MNEPMYAWDHWPLSAIAPADQAALDLISDIARSQPYRPPPTSRSQPMGQPAPKAPPLTLTSPLNPAAIRAAIAELQNAMIGTDSKDMAVLNALGQSPGMRPTQDLRHALKMIPSGLGWLIGMGAVKTTEPPYGVIVCDYYDGENEHGRGEHICLEIAICIAALQAHLSQLEQAGE